MLVAPSVASAAYPKQNTLPVWPDNPNDASIAIGVTPYDEIAPKLNALQAASNRVSARVAGRSSGGRDIYVVTVTAPETDAQEAQQAAWKSKIVEEPVAARTDAALLAGYKTPIFVNGNIHGNEWEGTDAILRVIDQYAKSTDPAVETLLQRNRLVFNVTSNPDGRVAGTRENGAGYDLNRDQVNAVQPEARIIRDLTAQTQSVWLLDLHGYVTPTLLWPSTPPHNPNTEYDLYIKHGLAGALDIEQGLKDLGYAETQRARIPFRDDAAGVWDDYPPIYVPSFGLFQATIPYTIEAPLNPRGGTLTPAERLRRSGINTDVHEVAIKKSLAYIQTNRNQLIFDQAEFFRRGWAGEPQKDIPVGFVPGWDPDDIYKGAPFPRSYVIPAGERQRSAPAVRASPGAADLQQRPRDGGQGPVHRRGPLLPGGLVHHRPAPAAPRHRQHAAGAGPGHHRPRRRPVRRPRGLEPGADVGRDRRHARDRDPGRRDRARALRRDHLVGPDREHGPRARSA